MTHFGLTRIIALLGEYGYAVMLPIAVVEGPAMAMVAGALAAAGQMNPFVACLLLVLADLVGDAGYYALGRYGHGPLFEKISKRLSLTSDRFKPLEKRFHDHDWKLIMIGKTQALGSVILYFAGASRMSFIRYMVLNLIGTAPKVILFELIGYFLGQSILHSTRYIDYITFVLGGIAAVLLVLYFVIRRLLARELADDIST